MVLYYSRTGWPRKFAYQALLIDEFARAAAILFGLLNLAVVSRVIFPGDKTA